MPFSSQLWVVLVLYGLMAALVIRRLYCFSSSPGQEERPSSVLGQVAAYLSLYWAVLNSYLGKPPPPHLSKTSHCNHLRLGVFAVFLCSTFVWAIYKASLTSELVSQVFRKPFDSLETFLQTDYQ